MIPIAVLGARGRMGRAIARLAAEHDAQVVYEIDASEGDLGLIAQSKARGDGSWSDQICTDYATAMALLILEVPNNYLSIFQK